MADINLVPLTTFSRLTQWIKRLSHPNQSLRLDQRRDGRTDETRRVHMMIKLQFFSVESGGVSEREPAAVSSQTKWILLSNREVKKDLLVYTLKHVKTGSRLSPAVSVCSCGTSASSIRPVFELCSLTEQLTVYQSVITSLTRLQQKNTQYIIKPYCCY